MIHFITPDRGDRPQFLEHCKAQFMRMHPAGNIGKHWIINDPPRTDKPDLTARIQRGYNLVKANPNDWVFILENDDFYPVDYLQAFAPHMADHDFIGCASTIYYNLRNRTWEMNNHPGHSSLFCTAFRVSAMAGFKWHMAHGVFLDLDIWTYAKRFRRKFIDTGAIGIKHGQGLCGGKGHKQVFPNGDPNLDWLRLWVDQQSFEFYSSLNIYEG